jgi:excisionase family DNA binding protein
MSSETAVPKQWLNVSEAAAHIGVTKNTIYAYVSKRRIPFYKIPKSQLVKFKISDLNEWLESGKVETIDEYLNPKEE